MAATPMSQAEAEAEVLATTEMLYNALGALEDLVRASKHLSPKQKAEIGKIIAGAVIDHLAGTLPPSAVIARLRLVIDQINSGEGPAKPTVT